MGVKGKFDLNPLLQSFSPSLKVERYEKVAIRDGGRRDVDGDGEG